MENKGKSNLPIIGSTEYVEIFGIKNIPAKIDTGADSSSIWASNIDMKKDGTLSFVLFCEGSPFYTGDQIHIKDYVARIVRSSNGDSEIRYRVKLPLIINGRRLEATFTLADRAKNQFPILIGRYALDGNFVVDVSKKSVPIKKIKRTNINEELKNNPYLFHQRYIKKGKK